MQKIPETFSKCSAQSLFSAEKNLLKNRLQSSIFSPEILLENPKKCFLLQMFYSKYIFYREKFEIVMFHLQSNKMC